MRQFLPIIIAVLILTSVIVLGFTILQAHSQQASLTADLEYRTQVLADSLRESVEPAFVSNSKPSLQKILDKFTDKQRLLGMAVYDNEGVASVFSGSIDQATLGNALAGKAMDFDKAVGEFVIVNKNKIYEFAEPLHQDGAVIGALLVAQKADYIDFATMQIWTTNLLRLLLQALVFALALVLILRWLIFQPVLIIVRSIKQIHAGKAEQELDALKNYSFFKPIAAEISKISASLVRAKSAALEEARMRLEKLDTPWTAERLQEFIKANLKNRKIFVVSNREPYVHINSNEYSVPAGGAVTAIDPLMQACGGMWLAWGSGEADKETADAEGKIQVPPDDPKYTLKRIWLSEKEQKGFYAGFCNEAIWPLCHNAHTRPIFRKEDWQEYRRVNGKFTESILKEIKKVERPLILVQDFHFALLPQMIKKSRPDAQIGLFWHVPWPTPEVFSICPYSREILEAMLCADIVGFHIQQYCNNFMDTVGKGIESMIDLEQFSITFKGHLTQIKPFPISISFANGAKESKGDAEKDKKLLAQMGIESEYFGLGVDRIDYTKGILERFKGIEFFFSSHPNYIGKFTFLQIAEPSREIVERYRKFNEEITAEAARINAKLSKNGWKPIVLLKKHFSHEELQPLYRQADVCLVTSLHDGMNLVSKEFVAARNDEAGVLILSQFAGASKDLKGAIIINPYSAERTAQAINEALNMPIVQQRRRMKKMRESVKNYNIYRWSAEFMKAIINLD